MTCPHCSRTLLVRSRGRVTLAGRRPIVSYSDRGVEVVIHCLLCNRQIRLEHVEAAMAEELEREAVGR